MLFVILSDTILNSNLVHLMLTDLLISKNSLFHDDVVRRLIVSKFQAHLIQLCFLVEQYINPAASHHSQKLNRRSLLLFTFLNQCSTLIWIKLFTSVAEIASIVEVCMPQAIIDWPFKHILLYQNAKHLFNASYVCESGITHHGEQMFNFLLSWNILIKVQGMIALNHGINDLLVLAVD